MDHEEYERQMIDMVNQNAEEKSNLSNINSFENKATKKMFSLLNRNDKRILVLGLRRTLLALLTTIVFAISVCCFIAVAMAQGYLAVVLFFAALMTMGFAFVLLYAQGILHKIPQESKGEIK